MGGTRFALCFDLFGLFAVRYLGPLLLTMFNLNPRMDNQLHPLYCVGWNHLSIPKHGSAVGVWERISNFIQHFTGHVITYPC